MSNFCETYATVGCMKGISDWFKLAQVIAIFVSFGIMLMLVAKVEKRLNLTVATGTLLGVISFVLGMAICEAIIFGSMRIFGTF